VKLRLICFCGALALVGAELALGAGNYQRTKDGKAMVWNGEPKPGDVASWFGGRDNDGYASGMGTLIWYTGDGQLYARYHGKMARGKLDGPVEVKSQGKTAHALFADGKRLTRWTREPAPERLEPGEEAVQTASSQSASVDDQSSQTATTESPRETATTPPPAEAPPVAKSEPVEQQPVDVAEKAADAATERPTPSTQSLPLDIPAEAPPTENRSENNREKSIASASAPAGRENVGRQTPAARPTITIENRPEVSDLSEPPSSLLPSSGAEKSPADHEPEIASQSTAKAQLTAQEAIALGDSGAEARGYDLAAYDRPKADYSAVLGKWSLFYTAREPDTGNAPPHFTVTVDDATKQVDVRQ
jgi:hypothetical protein